MALKEKDTDKYLRVDQEKFFNRIPLEIYQNEAHRQAGIGEFHPKKTSIEVVDLVDVLSDETKNAILTLVYNEIKDIEIPERTSLLGTKQESYKKYRDWEDC